MIQPRQSIELLVGEVLGGAELHYALDTHNIEENWEDGEVSVRCSMHDRRSGELRYVEGCGTGLVDAFFTAMVQQHSEQFASLSGLTFADLTAHTRRGSGARTSDSDALVDVTLRLSNSDGEELVFGACAPSLGRASLQAVLQGVEFFINAERAFVAVYRALQHAQSEGRPDSVAHYTAQLATLVQATSYAGVIARLRG